MARAPKLPLTEALPYAHRTYLSLGCRSCGHRAEMGIRRAVRLAGGQSTEEWLERLRCTRCGGRGANITLCADTRGEVQKERDGPLPVTLQD